MLALEEGLPQHLELTPAREMSDGLLRFVAVATALLTPNRGLDIDPGLTVGDGARGVLLVIVEVENGLHPSQAGRVLQLIKEASSDLAKKVMVTTVVRYDRVYASHPRLRSSGRRSMISTA